MSKDEKKSKLTDPSEKKKKKKKIRKSAVVWLQVKENKGTNAEIELPVWHDRTAGFVC